MASIRTPLCDQLGIDSPIFSGGFVEGATAELVAAVSGAGGCGVLGGCPPDESRRRIAHVRRLTDRPFGQNIIIANFDDPSETDEEGRKHDRERVEAAIAGRVPILVLFWGDPAPFVDKAHAAGTKVFIQSGSVDEARHAAEAGVDAVIAQGLEAGGHVSANESLWDVLPARLKASAPPPVIPPAGRGAGSPR